MAVLTNSDLFRKRPIKIVAPEADKPVRAYSPPESGFVVRVLIGIHKDSCGRINTGDCWVAGSGGMAVITGAGTVAFTIQRQTIGCAAFRGSILFYF